MDACVNLVRASQVLATSILSLTVAAIPPSFCHGISAPLPSQSGAIFDLAGERKKDITVLSLQAAALAAAALGTDAVVEDAAAGEVEAQAVDLLADVAADLL